MDGDTEDEKQVVITSSFVFSQEDFRDYLELFVRTMDRASGPRIAVCFGLCGALCMLFGFETVASVLQGHFAISERSRLSLFFLLASIFFFFFSLALGGVRRSLGLRRQKWNSPRWRAREAVSFTRLSSCEIENPLCFWVPAGKRPKDNWPDPLKSAALLTLLMPAIFYSDSVFDDPIAFDTVPGLLPRFPALENAPTQVAFSAAFHPAHIEKGAHGAVFARSYAEVHDVVEDSRYPGLAIVRHENGYSQLVVRTDLLEGGTWDEVKSRIAAAKEGAG